MLSALARIPLIRRVGLNTTWLALGRIAALAQLGVFTLLVARRLGEAGFGQYSWIASIVLLGNVFTTFGTDTLLIREIARDRSARSAIPVLGLQLALSVLLIAGIWAWVGLAPELAPETGLGLRLYALALLPLAVTSVLTAVLRGWERMDLYLLANLLTGLIQLAGAWAVLRGAGAASLLRLVEWLLATQLIGALIAGGLCLSARLPVVDRRLPGRQAAGAYDRAGRGAAAGAAPGHGEPARAGFPADGHPGAVCGERRRGSRVVRGWGKGGRAGPPGAYCPARRAAPCPLPALPGRRARR